MLYKQIILLSSLAFVSSSLNCYANLNDSTDLAESTMCNSSDVYCSISQHPNDYYNSTEITKECNDNAWSCTIIDADEQCAKADVSFTYYSYNCETSKTSSKTTKLTSKFSCCDSDDCNTEFGECEKNTIFQTYYEKIADCIDLLGPYYDDFGQYAECDDYTQFLSESICNVFAASNTLEKCSCNALRYLYSQTDDEDTKDALQANADEDAEDHAYSYCNYYSYCNVSSKWTGYVSSYTFTATLTVANLNSSYYNATFARRSIYLSAPSYIDSYYQIVIADIDFTNTAGIMDVNFYYSNITEASALRTALDDDKVTIKIQDLSAVVSDLSDVSAYNFTWNSSPRSFHTNIIIFFIIFIMIITF